MKLIFHINYYNRLASKIRQAFANGSSANIKFLKIQLSEIIQSGRILGELLEAIL